MYINFWKIQKYNWDSIVLDVLEQDRFFDRSTQPVSVLDVTRVIANAGVENVAQWVLPQKQVTQHTHGCRMFVVQPHASQISNRIYSSLFILQLLHVFLITDTHFFQDRTHFRLVFLNKRYYGFTVVFRNVFRLVFQAALLLFQTVLFYFLLNLFVFMALFDLKGLWVDFGF